jgi:phosphomannomutase
VPIHVRASNIEPIVRVIADEPGAAGAKQLCCRVKEML